MRVLFIALGCDKNLVDAEVMLGLLAAGGYQMTDHEEEAEIIVVNTCCFIQDAKEESIEQILEMAEQKKKGNLKCLIVTGCMAQRYEEEITKEIPEVDAVVGTTSYDKILEVIDQALAGKQTLFVKDADLNPVTSTKRLLTTGGHFAYLKIAEGCDKHCTYCIIPKIRGNFRSFPMENLIEEAKDLASRGVKELIIIAQETTLYGVDLYGEKRLPELLKELCKIPELYWIRMMYCYPEEITKELLQVIHEESKICNYLDIPIQHCNDEVLRRMGRRMSKEELTQIICQIRRFIPGVCLRTTLIAGFPGETQKQHQELVDFVEEMRFDRLGVFTYSQEEDTPAALLDGQLPQEVKDKRRDEIMEAQQEIAFETGESLIGQEMLIMIEGKVADENAYVGRTFRDAPNVDGFIFVNTDTTLISGDFVNVTITGALEYDLIGGLTDELAQ